MFYIKSLIQDQKGNRVTEIILYELNPTRSARCRWTLLEAGLKYESRGNTIEVFSSQELKQTHPLGKLPAAVINGKPLFESAAICTAIADLVPEQNLIAKSGTWARALHDQWTLFVLTEIEPYLWSTELNTDKNGFLLPNEEQVPAIADQNRKFAQRAAVALDAHLQNQEYLVENRFTVTDIITGYTVGWLEEVGLLESFPSLTAYLNRLSSRQHCTLTRHN
ncbi:MAG: glutathione S-transferase family protein [Gammaproteobacteria bacterium]|nr:glutathione S-transferase family protein [Gammaproteobacteria bacterium]